MDDYVIDVKGLWTQFGDNVVHRESICRVGAAKSCRLVGGSGSGKTTMLRQMIGSRTARARRSAQCSAFRCTAAMAAELRQPA